MASDGIHTYTYDRYGNRWAQNALQGGPSPSVSFDVTTNHINSSGYAYDAAGNLINDGTHSYTYDAEGNLTAVDGGATAKYTYDALNRRIRQDLPQYSQEFLFDPAGQRVSIWDPAQPAAYYGWNVYWGSKPLAFNYNYALHFQHQDWLGTERIQTSYNGATESQYATLPFGDGNTITGDNYDQYDFAGMDYDAISDTQHAQFRQFTPTQGRWMSPDPYAGSYDINNPQSMNRYSYVLNNPLAFVDPSGLHFEVIGNCLFEVLDASVDGNYDSTNYYLIGCSDDSGGGGGGGGGNRTAQAGGGDDGGGGGGGRGFAPSKPGIFTCAANFANKYSIAGGLHALGVGNNGGVGGFLTNALGGNAFSGLTSAVTQGMSIADVAFSGTYLGFGGTTAVQKGITGVTTDAAVGGAWSSVTGAGQTIETLEGVSSLASTGVDAAEVASGVGLVKIGYDGLSYAAGLYSCASN